MPRTLRVLLALAALVVCGSVYLATSPEDDETPWWIGTWEHTRPEGQIVLVEVAANGNATFGEPGSVNAVPCIWSIVDGGISIVGIFGEVLLLRDSNDAAVLVRPGGGGSEAIEVHRSTRGLAPKSDREAFLEWLAPERRDDSGGDGSG